MKNVISGSGNLVAGSASVSGAGTVEHLKAAIEASDTIPPESKMEIMNFVEENFIELFQRAKSGDLGGFSVPDWLKDKWPDLSELVSKFFS